MIVVDASAAVLGLLNDGDARAALVNDPVIAPHLVDSEVASALRSRVLQGAMPAQTARAALRVWSALGLTRFPVVGLLERVWKLRDNVSAYDASYVALAEAAGVDLVTADARLASAPGPRCAIRVLRT